MTPMVRVHKKSVICGILQNVVVDYLSKKDGESEYIGLDLKSVVADRMGFFTGSILFAIMDSVYSNIVSKHSEKHN